MGSGSYSFYRSSTPCRGTGTTEWRGVHDAERHRRWVASSAEDVSTEDATGQVASTQQDESLANKKPYYRRRACRLSITVRVSMVAGLHWKGECGATQQLAQGNAQECARNTHAFGLGSEPALLPAYGK